MFYIEDFGKKIEVLSEEELMKKLLQLEGRHVAVHDKRRDMTTVHYVSIIKGNILLTYKENELFKI